MSDSTEETIEIDANPPTDTKPKKKPRGRPTVDKELENNKVLSKQREIQAVQLRRAGATFDEIGEQLGCTGMSAYRMVARYIERVQKQFAPVAEEVLTIELERCDMLLVRHFATLSQMPDNDVDGLVKVTKSILAIQDRRARYLGLNKDSPLVQMKLEQGTTKNTIINNNQTTIGEMQTINVVLPIVKNATTDELIELREKLQAIKSRGDEQIITQAGRIAVEARVQPEAEPSDGSGPVDTDSQDQHRTGGT